MKKLLSLAQVRQQHKFECPDVAFETFMEHYCKLQLEEGKYTCVEVIVSPSFKFVFK